MILNVNERCELDVSTEYDGQVLIEVLIEVAHINMSLIMWTACDG
jgi:hypothetical protein